MRAAYRARLVANLVNGSTLAGLLVAAAGRAPAACGLRSIPPASARDGMDLRDTA